VVRLLLMRVVAGGGQLR